MPQFTLIDPNRDLNLLAGGRAVPEEVEAFCRHGSRCEDVEADPEHGRPREDPWYSYIIPTIPPSGNTTPISQYDDMSIVCRGSTPMGLGPRRASVGPYDSSAIGASGAAGRAHQSA